jgi:hypothetical protein
LCLTCRNKKTATPFQIAGGGAIGSLKQKNVTVLRATSPVRIMAIGDIHGQLDMLNRLLHIIEPKSTDQFVFLGDYINRGQDVCKGHWSSHGHG